MSTVLLASKKTRPEAAAVQNEAEMRIKSWRLSPLPKEVDSSCNYRSRCILSNILGIFNLLATYRVVKQDFNGAKYAALNQKSILNQKYILVIFGSALHLFRLEIHFGSNISGSKSDSFCIKKPF